MYQPLRSRHYYTMSYSWLLVYANFCLELELTFVPLKNFFDGVLIVFPDFCIQIQNLKVFILNFAEISLHLS